jgi:hypothetical protein
VCILPTRTCFELRAKSRLEVLEKKRFKLAVLGKESFTLCGKHHKMAVEKAFSNPSNNYYIFFANLAFQEGNLGRLSVAGRLLMLVTQPCRS